MPNFKEIKEPNPIQINKFLGLNQSVGETEIKLGETVKQLNWRLTQDYKPKKRAGHNTVINFGNTKDCQGGWTGIINSTEVLIMVNNGNVYEYDLSIDTDTTAIADLITEGTVTLIGTITDLPTNIYRFNDNIFFQNGTDFKYYNGTTYGNATDIAYIPVIAIETPPSGGGTDFEQVNLLTGKKWQWFTGDNTSTTYVLREASIDATTLVVTVDGVTVVEGVGFTVNRTLGTLDFSAGTTPFGAPITDALVKIKYEKANATNLGFVTGNKYAMDFGPGNDVSVFLWGHATYKNKRIWSGTTYEGVFDGTYFKETNFTEIGSKEFAITDIIQQYNRQIIFKTDRSYYSYAEYISTTETYDYPVFDLNESIGNIAYHGVQLIENNPVSLYKQAWWMWRSTQVEDERNTDIISQRIRLDLDSTDLSTAITFDYQEEKELWVNIGSIVYIYNYGNDTFYEYDNISAKWFLSINGIVYYGANGTVQAFNGLADNGVAVNAVGELGFNNFNVPELLKNARVMWVEIYPYNRTSLTISYATNKFNTGTAKVIKPVKYVLFSFDDIDFGDFSFSTNRNPQTERRNIRANNFTTIKIIFSNNELDEEVALLGIKVLAETQGYV